MQPHENANLILVSKRCNTKTIGGPGKNKIILPTDITKAGNDSSPVMKKITKPINYKTTQHFLLWKIMYLDYFAILKKTHS